MGIGFIHKMNDLLAKISIIQQKYIETISLLCQDHNHAHTKQIALVLQVKMPSVVDALKGLAKLNLINYRTRQPVTLTRDGEVVALKLNARHKAFSDFFNLALGLDVTYSEQLACSIEHVVDDELKNRLSSFNSYIERKPEIKELISQFKKEQNK